MQKRKFAEEHNNANLPEIEKQLLNYWKNNDIFQKSIDQYDKANDAAEFIFYDGPPFANGLPHYGHLLTGFVKDTVARYQTQNGKKVERRFGWDCHGLPAEMGAEKDLNISGRTAIEEYGIEKFNDHCRKSVMKYASNWKEYVTRSARWVDFENSYKTMDKNFMESVIWAFSELHKKGLIYKAMRVMPYSWACQTPLSNFETRLDNSYRERADKAVTVAFSLNGAPKCISAEFSEYKLLAWTTTPWTLPSNLALAVNPDMDYVAVEKDAECLIVAKFALKAYKKELGLDDDLKYLNEFKGKELAGLKYEPILDYFKNHQNAFKIIAADFVIEGDGTGIVHIAPGFGEDDQEISARENIEIVCPVDNAGKFTSEVADFEGMLVFDANDEIIKMLKNRGSWIKTEQYLHNYPHCWRTDTPLIYKAVPSWYVKVTAIKDRMVELNQQINWIPSNIKDGLFGKWLENARDWSISRNRFWGTPIPVWESDDPKYPRIEVYGSIKEIEQAFDVKLTDLHKPYIDELTRPNPDDPTGKSIMKRTSDVFDCWFESGSMPYAQCHYPFENKEWFDAHFPADFIVEYTAQTRGWFYTLMILSTALFDRPPFLNCICHGVILDSSGQKLSKRLNNYADPLDIFDKYGADALRITMLSSNVVKGQELLIDKDGEMIFDAIRLLIKPMLSSLHFYCLYANIDEIEGKISYESANILDNYILSKLEIVTSNIKLSMDNYDINSGYKELANFFEILNNWFIRRSRSRFWQAEKNQDKIDAFNTLYTCLIVISNAAAALLPLLSEYIYLTLRKIDFNELAQNADIQSVHLEQYPKINFANNDDKLVSIMDQVRDICSNGLYIRSQKNIRVRQPIGSAVIIAKDIENIKKFDDIIRDELNIKTIKYDSNIENYANEKLFINFPVLGKRLPKKMKDIIVASKRDEWIKTDKGIEICESILNQDEYELKLVPNTKREKDEYITESVYGANSGLLIIDTKLDEELLLEGGARDIIRLVQQARKDANCNVADRINIVINGKEYLQEVYSKFKDLIQNQTLSEISINININKQVKYQTTVELDDEKFVISIL